MSNFLIFLCPCLCNCALCKRTSRSASEPSLPPVWPAKDYRFKTSDSPISVETLRRNASLGLCVAAPFVPVLFYIFVTSFLWSLFSAIFHSRPLFQKGRKCYNSALFRHWRMTNSRTMALILAVACLFQPETSRSALCRLIIRLSNPLLQDSVPIVASYERQSRTACSQGDLLDLLRGYQQNLLATGPLNVVIGKFRLLIKLSALCFLIISDYFRLVSDDFGLFSCRSFDWLSAALRNRILLIIFVSPISQSLLPRSSPPKHLKRSARILPRFSSAEILVLSVSPCYPSSRLIFLSLSILLSI